MRVNDNQIECVYKCEECGEETSVTPDWHEDNGTPVCTECDCDMAYDHTQYHTAPNDDENVKAKFWKLWEELLNTDEGVGEEAYEALFNLAQSIDLEKLQIERQKVDATDGRFYIG